MKFIHTLKLALIIVGVTLLSSCTTPKPPAAQNINTATPNQQQTQETLATSASTATNLNPAKQLKGEKKLKADATQLSNWNIKGAVSIRSSKGTNLGAFSWQQNSKANYKIQIAGPLNMGNVQLIGNPGQITLIKGDGKQASAASPENLMRQQLGWYIPISNLYYWVRGLAAPGISADKSFDKEGHLVHLAQQGWNIQLGQFRLVDNYELPGLLELYNPALKIKIVIRNWSV